MPNLQVRDIPADVYETLARVAKAENRSIAQEAVVLLRSALGQPEESASRRKKVLAELEDYSIEAAEKKRDDTPLPDPVALVREDRDR